jgi:hypothetical protein
MTTIRNVIAQEMIEKRYSRKHIDGYIREAIEGNPDMQLKIIDGVNLINTFMAKKYYASKELRLAQIKDMDMPALVLDIFVGIAYCLKEELFTSVSAQLASRLKFSDKPAAIQTIAELLAVLCLTDAFDISKSDKMASLMITSHIPLNNKLLNFIEFSQYLPPMVCEPLELVNNFSNGYLTHNDSLILGSGNHHDGDICLDVLNLMNKTQLKLDTHFLSTVEEDVNTEITIDSVRASAAEKGKYLNDAEAKEAVIKQKEHWEKFKKQSYVFYSLIANHQDPFYLTNKVDKRGRVYTQGYHINVQGTAFKKSCINLAKEELVTGVPT